MYAEEPDVFDSLTDQNATHDAMNRMELFGAMPPADEVDPRPLPDQNTSFASLEGVFDTLAELFTDTCLESEATDVLWNTVNTLPAPPDDKGNPLAHSSCVNRTDDERQEWKNCKSGPVYPSSLFCNPARSCWWALRILALKCQHEAPVPVFLSFVVESLSRYDTRTSPTPTRRPQGGRRMAICDFIT